MQCFTSSGPDGLLGIAHVQLLAHKHLAFVVPSLSTGDMSIPVQGRVTSQNNQAILMLWDWDPMAEAKLLEFLAKLKKIVAPKPITLSLPAPAPAAASFCI